MPFFAIIIIISLALYVYYKFSFLRSKQEMEKHALTAKSRLALGIFVLTFGLNQLFIWNTTLTMVIGGLFILYGGFFIIQGYKAYRYYAPLAKGEGTKL